MQSRGFANLRVRYLEHMVNERGSTDATLHTALVLAYVDSMRTLWPSQNTTTMTTTTTTRVAPGQEPGLLGALFLRSRNNNNNKQ